MRLIYAELALQRFIKETETSGKNAIHINTIKRLLQDMDTAYDVEKVVAELENEYDNIPFQYESNYEDGFSDGLLKAIDIVRKGGAE